MVLVLLLAIGGGWWMIARRPPAPRRSGPLKLAPLVPLRGGMPAAPAPPVPSPTPEPAGLPSGAIEAVAPPPPGALEDMIASARPAIVLIESSTGRGTGFFVKPDLIVTNAHVVRGSATVMLRFSDGRTGSAAVSTIGDGVDLATLRPAPGSANHANLELSPTDHIRAGQEVIAIGSALGVLQNTVTRGIISAIRNDGGVLLLQTDAAINPGNSGGPLLDRSGRVVGVNTMKIGTAASIGFAIAAEHVVSLLDGRGGAITARDGTSTAPSMGMPPVPAQKSEPDESHGQAVNGFEQQLKAIAQRSDQIDDYWKRFRTSCNTAAAGKGGDREWFGVWSDRPDIKTTVPDCTVWLNDLIQLATDVRGAMVAADEKARRDGVYPGEVRSLRSRYHLDWAGWDR